MATLDDNVFIIKYDSYNKHTKSYHEVFATFLTKHDNIPDASKAFEDVFGGYDGENKRVIIKEIKHLK